MKTFKLFLILTFSLFLFQHAYGQINVKDSLQTILQNDTVDAGTRFRQASYLIILNALPDEAEILCQTVMYPFVQKSWESKSDQLSRLARLYLYVGACHRDRGGNDRYEQERSFNLKAVETAKESGDDAVYSHCLVACGYMECKRGDVKKGNEYFYQAIDVYDKMKKYDSTTEMLYLIGLNFLQIKDADGLQRVAAQMEPYLEKDKSKQTLYQYNKIKKLSIEMLLEKAKNESKLTDYQMVDEVISVIRSNIELVENFRNELNPYFLHGWAYWDLSKVFYDYYPAHTDTIFHYLDKASLLLEQQLHIAQLEPNSEKELKIQILQLRAKTFVLQEKMQDAFLLMNEALNLLNELKDFQIFDEQRFVAYQFMSEYYEKTNRPAEALKYQKLLRESEAKRYETEKIQALNDMLIKYETEKKEIQINTLAKENKTARRILRLTTGMFLALLTTLILVVITSRMKRKNMEQQLYEMALIAELNQKEFEESQKRQAQLQTQTQQTQQPQQPQNEHYPTKNTVEKIIWLIENSIIEKDTKRAYINRLSNIDIQLLEHAHKTSKEKISGMDMKYIVCFAAGMEVKDISLFFNVEPASVRTVRYRIKKKFAKENTFRAIL